MTLYYKENGVELYHGDMFDVVPDVRREGLQFDLVLTDPPYSAYVHKNDNIKNIDFPPFTESDILKMFETIRPACRGWVVATMAFEHVNFLMKACGRSLDFDFIRMGIWVKTNSAPHINRDRPSQNWEAIAMLRVPNAPHTHIYNGLLEKHTGSVFTYPFPSTDRHHPTQKPVTLYEMLIQIFTHKGDTVLDPFAGSGTSILAARNTGRSIVAIERDKKYINAIMKRLSQQRMAI